MAGAEIELVGTVAQALEARDHVLVLAPRQALKDGLARRLLADAPDAGGAWAEALDAMVQDTDPGALGKVVSTFTGRAAPRRVSLGVLPDSTSRHASPSRNHALFECASKADLRGAAVGVVVVLDDPEHQVAAVVALGRVFRRYLRKSSPKPAPKVTVALVRADGRPIEPTDRAQDTLEATRWAAALVDRPTDEKSTEDVVVAARALVGKKVKASVLEGKALVRAGLRGVYAVGRAAPVPPRFLHLSHRPAGKAKGKGKRLKVALVGKGIVFDTGGLHLKPRGGMEGMKSDMGGAAAVVGAFHVLVREGLKVELHALVPLAENAIGPDAYRPDEVLTLHSGKTVEINNTDAEGRLLLADAVSWARRELEPDLIIDAATLTGAQLVSTGKRHAAVVASRAGLEALAVRAGRLSGDLVHPLPFAPEFYQSEFKSEVADMTNSVKDRNNAQSSCAAQFIWGHISEGDPAWLHVDLAGPAFVDQKGTGYGVALLAEVVRSLTAADLEA